MKISLKALISIALIVLTLATQSANSAGKPFPKKIFTPKGSAPEGFTIGKGTTAYNGSLDGSIYKLNLRTGRGRILVPVQDPDIAGGACVRLGMRVDPRTNYLFVAGCIGGNAYVYDADSGALIMEYQLDSSGESVVNDLAITRDAVYFTDSYRPFLYRLPLSKNGELPLDPGAAAEIPLPADLFTLDFENDFCCAANGIVATPDGKTLIIGHSNDAKLYRVKPETGEVDEIFIESPLDGFLDGIAMKGRYLYIMTPTVPDPKDRIQVVKLDKRMRSGKLVRTITDRHLDDVASGAIFGNYLYVNNARYSQFPGGDTRYWITKLELRPKKRHDDDARD